MKFTIKNKIFTVIIFLLFTVLWCCDLSEKEIDASVAYTSDKEIKILFIGNSHTYYNDMPEMVKGLAAADGIKCDVKSITASGYKLYKFANQTNVYGAQVYEALNNEKWDFVVLQENREILVENIEKSSNAVSTLYEMISNSGAKLVMYATQPDQTGNNFTINNMSMYLTNLQIEQILTRNNFSISNQYNGLTATSGTNFMRLMAENPDISLYNSDQLHPSVSGSYLAACTIYATIFDRSPMGNGFLPDSEYDTEKLLNKMDMNTALILQQTADARLSINEFNVMINKGEKSQLTAELVKNEENHSLDKYLNTILWSSVDAQGVSINRYTGEYTALSTGKHLVAAQTDSGLISYATIDVKQPSTSFSIEESKILKVTKGYTATYTAVMAPADTTDEITWSSNEPKIVSVDSEGTITAKKVGVAKITAETTSGLKVIRYVRVKLKAPSKVTVKKTSTKAKRKNYANIKVQWKKNANAVKYYVYRKTSGESYKKIATTTKSSYIDNNKKKGKIYYYKIQAVYFDTRCNSVKSTAVKIEI
jgi:hypothetical protein